MGWTDSTNHTVNMTVGIFPPPALDSRLPRRFPASDTKFPSSASVSRLRHSIPGVGFSPRFVSFKIWYPALDGSLFALQLQLVGRITNPCALSFVVVKPPQCVDFTAVRRFDCETSAVRRFCSESSAVRRFCSETFAVRRFHVETSAVRRFHCETSAVYSPRCNQPTNPRAPTAQRRLTVPNGEGCSMRCYHPPPRTTQLSRVRFVGGRQQQRWLTC
jgi:hypothetical protein